MLRAARALVAGIVILAFGTLPLAMDCCAISCLATESAGPTGVSGAMPGMTGCHHSTQTGTRINQSSDPCGHHHAAVMVAEAASPQRLVTAAPGAAIVMAASWAVRFRFDPRGARTIADTVQPIPPHARSLSLRI